MKKYIIIICIALLGLGSCVVGDGSEKSDRDYSSRMLAEQVVYTLSPVTMYPQFAIYAEALFAERQTEAEFVKELYFKDANIFVDEGKVIFLIGTNYYDQYELRTDGKSLAEGGVWQLVKVNGTANTTSLASISGSEGEEDCFRFNYNRLPYRYYYSNDACSVSTDIEYLIGEESVTLEVRGEGHIGENDEYRTVFDIYDEYPLLYEKRANEEGSYLGGQVDIVYEDLKTKKTKSLTMNL